VRKYASEAMGENSYKNSHMGFMYRLSVFIRIN